MRVAAVGPQALVQDTGRIGHAGIGVGRSGAADLGSYAAGNRALGNEPGAAAVETLLGGLAVGVGGDPLWMCVTGAPCDVHVDERPVGSHRVFSAAPGSTVRLGTPSRGARSYLCVRGGIDVPVVLGSRSTDLLSGLGPGPLRAGDVLAVGPSTADLPAADMVPTPDLRTDDQPVELRAVRGPREDWLADPEALTTTTWRVSDRSNRVGARLEVADGPGLAHAGAAELPSEGVRRGAVQVPPSGEPVLFGSDHPVTGGYPVVAVVVDADVDRAAQLRPGQALRFRWVRP
ncbi:biotin-dependent carboxyltransferase family protein [Nocardioidaceae bacterium]|nr:biotin-dependent carboxyltransferase family protein [Nocardioidaceae bacterium]